MKIKRNEPPREYAVGHGGKIIIKDCAHIVLSDDEQITLKTERGGEYDVARKDWGFYATPSINGRLADYGFKTALIKNRHGKFYIFLVEETKESEFNHYMQIEDLTICGWLDEATLAIVEQALASSQAAS